MSSRLKDLKTVFTSEARVRVLARLLLHTADRFYQSEIADLEKLPLKAVQRELVKLLRFGLVRRSGIQGRHQYYQVNRRHLLYAEFKAILLKTILVGIHPERLRKPPLSKVRFAFIFGSVAKADEDRKSDIDILVVGSITAQEWNEAIRDSRLRNFREENSMVMPEAEFQERFLQRESFLMNVCAGSKIFLIGGEDDLKRLIDGAKAPAPSTRRR